MNKSYVTHIKNENKHIFFFLIFDSHRVFEKIRQYFGAQSESIPMSFVLGFYVSLIVKRWWEQYKLLPWPDTLALFISAAIPGNVCIETFETDNKSMHEINDKPNKMLTPILYISYHCACAHTHTHTNRTTRLE